MTSDIMIDEQEQWVSKGTRGVCITGTRRGQSLLLDRQFVDTKICLLYMSMKKLISLFGFRFLFVVINSYKHIIL